VNILLPLTVGALVAAGLYMMMRRSMMKLVIGLSLLSHAANLLIFTAGGLKRAAVPVIPEGHKELARPYADPLPQALILTAIVIGFAFREIGENLRLTRERVRQLENQARAKLALALCSGGAATRL